jgi:predicted xylose isomerase-like sugar epimerase
MEQRLGQVSWNSINRFNSYKKKKQARAQALAAY